LLKNFFLKEHFFKNCRFQVFDNFQAIGKELAVQVRVFSTGSLIVLRTTGSGQNGFSSYFGDCRLAFYKPYLYPLVPIQTLVLATLYDGSWHEQDQAIPTEL
jgi:hypothetical protein